MANIDLVCIECKKNFYWKDVDQEFYKAKGFQQPRRCYQCRQQRKNTDSQSQPAMDGATDGEGNK